MIESSDIRLQFLPTSVKEVEERGWSPGELDVILFSADAYVDHPAFGMAVIARVVEACGLKVAVVPQPNCGDDGRDFVKLGAPRLFFGVCPGAMDSMVNHYTAEGKRRHDDAYTPEGRMGARPDMPTIVYTQKLKHFFPEIPVVLGGIEASQRRLTHYDYWRDALRPSILVESGADLLIYGMGEKPITRLCELLHKGVPFSSLTNIPQTAFIRDSGETFATDKSWNERKLNSFEKCVSDKRLYAENFRIFEEESNRMSRCRLSETYEERCVTVNPPFPPLTTRELDAVYDLPFTRLPHPRYKGKRIPAYEMIRHSITLHRGCFGGCAFCTISAHQGKRIVSRSEASVLREVESIKAMPDFHGTITDLGGPSANMYRIGGRDTSLCEKCHRATCLTPVPCPNLNPDHAPLLALYKKVHAVEGVRHAFVTSGIRYDLMMHTPDGDTARSNNEYFEYLVTHCVSGRLKVAPEHTGTEVLRLMRKPPFNQFITLNNRFNKISEKNHLQLQLIPYFISGHPGCTVIDMAELAATVRPLRFCLEQVQEFTPTPMTLSTAMYYTGINPYTGQKIYSAKSADEKRRQKLFFFWYDKEGQKEIRTTLNQLKREDLVKKIVPLRPDSKK